MNTLRLENINLHAPYRVMQDPERNNNFYFVSDSDSAMAWLSVPASVLPVAGYTSTVAM